MSELGQLTVAGRVRAGDHVLADGRFALVSKVRRAQGRKPKTGENLHLVTADSVLKLNSTAPVRVRRATS